MKFEDVLGNGRLWAVIYDGDTQNILKEVFDQWGNLDYLESFFAENILDLMSYFDITDLEEAVFRTLEDANLMKSVILDINLMPHSTNISDRWRMDAGEKCFCLKRRQKDFSILPG